MLCFVFIYAHMYVPMVVSFYLSIHLRSSHLCKQVTQVTPTRAAHWHRRSEVHWWWLRSGRLEQEGQLWAKHLMTNCFPKCPKVREMDPHVFFKDSYFLFGAWTCRVITYCHQPASSAPASTFSFFMSGDRLGVKAVGGSSLLSGFGARTGVATGFTP